jgi:DNA polymerase III delta prime subunit
MNKNKAKLELFKLDRQIEKKIVEHANELGQYNKGIVENELQMLWDRKDILKNIINS